MENILSKHFWNKKEVADWINNKYQKLHPPLYCSVDIRNSGFKISHVDTNLFPSGFNNIPVEKWEQVSLKFHQFISDYYPGSQKILLITENFTRNEAYLENVSTLSKLFDSHGKQCITATTSDDLKKEDGVLSLNGWVPNLIILNTDLSSGVPTILTELKQPIIPHYNNGWHLRSKYMHFQAFKKLIDEFSKQFGIDEWLISSYFTMATNIDFKNKVGLEQLAIKTDRLLNKIQEKYNYYNIKEKPFIFIKSDHGTFGSGIMNVSKGEEILNINKKQRHSMHLINYGITNSQVILQEGIPTIYKQHNHPLEYTYYLVGKDPQFKIKRFNTRKTKSENLNSKGMVIEKDHSLEYNGELVLSQIAALATLFENEQHL